MANKDILNQNNDNIRTQGGWAPWAADINKEIYQNIEQIESQINQNQNQLSSHDQRLQSNQNQINQILGTELPNKQLSIDTINGRLSGYEEKMAGYDIRIVDFNTSSLNKLAEAYTNMADGELKSGEVVNRTNGLKQDRDFWLKLTYAGFCSVLFFDILFLLIKLANDRLNLLYSLLPINLVLGTFLYFIVAQYSYYKKLYMGINGVSHH